VYQWRENYVDEILRRLQDPTDEAKVNRLCPMSMRMGVVVLKGLRLGLSSKK